MDYYDFFNGRKEVISQDKINRLLLVRYKKDLILIEEYAFFCVQGLDNKYRERTRMRVTKAQIRKLNEMI